MNKLLLLLTMLPTIAVASAQTASSNFTPSSILSEGRWVKVRVDSTSVYEIDYETLRSMGFENPENVNVYGRGARPLDEQFTDFSGNPLYSPDLNQVAVTHVGDRLLFWGEGSSKIDWNNSDSDYGFTYASRNVYSDTGSYLLSEQGSPKLMETKTAPDDASQAPEISQFFAYVLRDDDRIQGTRRAGQIFWDTELTTSLPMMSIPMKFPDVVVGSDISLVGTLWASNDCESNSFTLQLRSGSLSASFPFPSKATTNFTNLFKNRVSSKAIGQNMTFVLKVGTSASFEKAAFDNLLVTYVRTLPSSPVSNLELVARPSDGGKRLLKPGGYQDFSVWEISDPDNVKILPAIESDDEQTSVYLDKENVARITVFDPSSPQRPILGWDVVNNVDLHTMTEERPDMLVITVPSLRPYVEQLKELHAQTDGVVVSIAEIPDIYNQYSGGTPDIMAYKYLIKNLHDAADSRLKNVLLFGPVTHDLRGVETGADNPVDELIIGYQSPITSIAADTPNINDFLTMLEEYNTQRHEYRDVQLGVGVLPCRGEGDAVRILKKIENFLTSTDYNETANRMLGIAGTGDANLHSKQLVEVINSYESNLLNTVITTPVLFDDQPLWQAPVSICHAINQGTLVSIYMGHSGLDALNHTYQFNKGHLNTLENDQLTFIMFGSCDITDFDHNRRGLGEGFVFDTDHGAFGATVTTRTAWSSQNEAFILQFISALTNDVQGNHRTSAISLGQAYAQSKNKMRSVHEHTFQLMADPSLTLPIPLREAKVSTSSNMGRPGKAIKMDGTIIDTKGQLDESFNGSLTASLLAPAVQITAKNYISANDASEPKQLYTLHNNVLSQSRCKVVDGQYSFSLEIPTNAGLTTGNVCAVRICAYDPEGRQAASATTDLVIDTRTEPSADELDNLAPVIDRIAYQPGKLSITINDNRSIVLATGAITLPSSVDIDGVSYPNPSLYASVESFEDGSVEALIDIPVDLAPGTHNVMVTAFDYAGNSSTRLESFDLYSTETLALSVPEVLTFDSVFTLEGVADDFAGTLVVTDDKGSKIASLPWTGASLYFINEEGTRAFNLPQGVYHGVVVGADADSGMSNTVMFAVP